MKSWTRNNGARDSTQMESYAPVPLGSHQTAPLGGTRDAAYGWSVAHAKPGPTRDEADANRAAVPRSPIPQTHWPPTCRSVSPTDVWRENAAYSALDTKHFWTNTAMLDEDHTVLPWLVNTRVIHQWSDETTDMCSGAKHTVNKSYLHTIKRSLNGNHCIHRSMTSVCGHMDLSLNDDVLNYQFVRNTVSYELCMYVSLKCNLLSWRFIPNVYSDDVLVILECCVLVRSINDWRYMLNSHVGWI